MTTLTAAETCERSARSVLEIGRAWMMDPATAAKGAELGLGDTGPFGFWTNGRAGVLGDVDHHLAAAAIGFMAPGEVARHWQARPADTSPWQAALEWFGCGATWARGTLAPIDDDRLRRLSDLARTLIDSADLSLGMLFAGSVRIPVPGEPAADVAINLNVLRELRGGAHLAACHAAGLGPHATIMSTDDPVRGGVPWAERFGWPAPHPTPDRGARARAEELTTAAMTPVFEALSPTERAEFIDLLDECHTVACPS